MFANRSVPVAVLEEAGTLATGYREPSIGMIHVRSLAVWRWCVDRASDVDRRHRRSKLDWNRCTAHAYHTASVAHRLEIGQSAAAVRECLNSTYSPDGVQIRMLFKIEQSEAPFKWLPSAQRRWADLFSAVECLCHFLA